MTSKHSPESEIARQLYIRNAELAIRNKTFSLLQRIDEVALSSLGVYEMARAISEILVQEFSYPFVGIALFSADRRRCQWVSFACKQNDQSVCDITHLKPLRASANNATYTAALKHNKTIITNIEDLLGGSVSKTALAKFDHASHVESAMVLPLHGAQPIGFLAIGLNRNEETLTRYEREVSEAMVKLVTISIEKAQTYTSLVETSERLKQANIRLKELDSLKTEFLSIASHQLRTPLSVNKGYLSMVLDGSYGNVNKKISGVVSKIMNSNESLVQLVNHLLNVTRIESGRIQLIIEPVDLYAITNDIIDFLSLKAKEKGLTLAFDTAPGHYVVQADKEKLKEVVTNLVENAIKYTERGEVHVSLAREQGLVRFTVTDTGIGMTQEDISHLFEKFSRGKQGQLHQISGTGLGLFVCKKLVELMHGGIEASSGGPDKGSTMSFWLPTAEPKQKQAPKAKRKKKSKSV